MDHYSNWSGRFIPNVNHYAALVLTLSMVTKESLLELERQFWTGDVDFYREKLSKDAIMVFPEPTGILERSEVLESLGGGNRWRSIDFENVRVLEVQENVFQLVYRAIAERREHGSEYSAFSTSTYVETNGSWQIVSHQQTPINK